MIANLGSEPVRFDPLDGAEKPVFASGEGVAEACARGVLDPLSAAWFRRDREG
jgi:hypothetical protein